MLDADAILRMLHFNEAASIIKKRETDDSASPYKILVLDAFSKSIIAPLVGVQDLRQKGGVTLHLVIDTPREPIPDVPAVYFVRATAENINRIVEVGKDCIQQEAAACLGTLRSTWAICNFNICKRITDCIRGGEGEVLILDNSSPKMYNRIGLLCVSRNQV